MLADSYNEQLIAMIATTEKKIELPNNWGEIASRRGPSTWTPDDHRRFVRFYFPTQAILELHQTLPHVPREPRRYVVLTKDLSRSGISFLHAGQLFPCEEMTLWLPQGKKHFVAVRCNRLNARCYEIGAQVV